MILTSDVLAQLSVSGCSGVKEHYFFKVDV